MNDLISRQALLQKLQGSNIPYNADINDLIINTPTAYNPDKVVEELESDEKHTFDGCINKRYAIDIVKRGGVE